MPLLSWKHMEIELDEDGFLMDSKLWTPDVAQALASSEGIAELTEAHWKVINSIRDHYQRFEKPPVVRNLCSETGLSLRDIFDLFPSGPVHGANKVAGLPRPNSCV